MNWKYILKTEEEKPIVELIKKMKRCFMESKIDKDKDGKITGKDFAMLRDERRPQ